MSRELFPNTKGLFSQLLSIAEIYTQFRVLNSVYPNPPLSYSNSISSAIESLKKPINQHSNLASARIKTQSSFPPELFAVPLTPQRFHSTFDSHFESMRSSVSPEFYPLESHTTSSTIKRSNSPPILGYSGIEGCLLQRLDFISKEKRSDLHNVSALLGGIWMDHGSYRLFICIYFIVCIFLEFMKTYKNKSNHYEQLKPYFYAYSTPPPILLYFLSSRYASNPSSSFLLTLLLHVLRFGLALVYSLTTLQALCNPNGFKKRMCFFPIVLVRQKVKS